MQKFFSFSAQQRAIIIILMLIIIIVNIYSITFKHQHFQSNNEIDQFKKEYASFNVLSSTNQNIITDKNITTPLKKFNPNVLNTQEWITMGIPEKTAHTITNYIHKGGKFKTCNDILKIYTFKKEWFDAIKDYCVIEHSSFNKQMAILKKININDADSIEWASLSGIGAGLTKRILKYKNLLGGFVSIQQIKEVYGISDTLFNNIKPYLELTTPANVIRIDLNTVDFKTLNNHPYIDFELCKKIMNYRSEKKVITHIDELLDNKVITKDIFDKMQAYWYVE